MTVRPPLLRISADELIVDSFAGGGGASIGIECACPDRDSGQCAAIRYGMDHWGEPCECPCHQRPDEDDDEPRGTWPWPTDSDVED